MICEVKEQRDWAGLFTSAFPSSATVLGSLAAEARLFFFFLVIFFWFLFLFRIITYQLCHTDTVCNSLEHLPALRQFAGMPFYFQLNIPHACPCLFIE